MDQHVQIKSASSDEKATIDLEEEMEARERRRLNQFKFHSGKVGAAQVRPSCSPPCIAARFRLGVYPLIACLGPVRFFPR